MRLIETDSVHSGVLTRKFGGVIICASGALKLADRLTEDHSRRVKKCQSVVSMHAKLCICMPGSEVEKEVENDRVLIRGEKSFEDRNSALEK